MCKPRVSKTEQCVRLFNKAFSRTVRDAQAAHTVHSSDQQVQHKQKGALKAGTHQLM